MAATYEVNIALNAEDFKAQLAGLKKDVDSIGKVRTKTAKDTKSAEDKSWASNNKRLRLENSIEASRLQQINLSKKGGQLDKEGAQFAQLRAELNAENTEIIRGLKLEQDLAIKSERTRLALEKDALKVTEDTAKIRKRVSPGYDTEEERYEMKLRELSERTAKSRKASRMERTRSLSLGNDIVKQTKKEVNLNLKNNEVLIKGKKIRESVKGDFSDIGTRKTYTPSGKGATYLNWGKSGTARFSGRSALSSAAISGGFPLLFGQNPAMAAVGALGGGIGGGFGGQMGGFAGGIAATAAATAIANAVNAVKDLGQAMGPFVQDTKALITATGQSNTFRAKELELIEQIQGKQAAFNEAMKDMTELVGDKGVKALKQFGEDTKRLSEDWTRFMTKLSAGLAGLINRTGIFGESRKSILKSAAGEFGGDEKLQQLLKERKDLGPRKSMGKGKNIDELLANELKIRERINNLRKDAAELDDAELLKLQHKANLVKKTESLYRDVGDAVKTGLVNAIEGAIEGTKTLGEVASSVFRSIGRMLLQYGISAGLASLGKPGGKWQKFFGFADGGRPPVGVPSIVGERGPELFVPDSAGTIVPNDELGGGGANVTVNVDASGSSVEGDAGQSAALGRMMAAAIQAELINQRRPGGLFR